MVSWNDHTCLFAHKKQYCGRSLGLLSNSSLLQNKPPITYLVKKNSIITSQALGKFLIEEREREIEVLSSSGEMHGVLGISSWAE